LRRSSAALLVLISFVCIWLGCGGEPEEGVLAKVDGTSITEAQLEERMAGMPAYMREQFEQPEGMKRLLDGLIEEELFYKDALATGIDKREGIKAEIERIERNVLIRHYFDKVIEVRSAVADSELVEYYEQHPTDFKVGEGDSVRPYAEVQEDIRSRLSYMKRREVHDELLNEFKAKYGVSMAPDSVIMAETADPDAELARVQGHAIRQADLDERLEAMPPYMREQFVTPQGRMRLLEGVVEEEIFYKEAKAQGLHEQADFKQEMQRVRRNILVKNYFDKVIQERSEPTQEEIVQYYEDHKGEFGYNEFARASHILVPTEEDARRVRSELDAGADFGELALKYSMDPMSRDGGGRVPHVILPQQGLQGLGMLPEFTTAVFSMEPGQVSAPVRTAKGYHIIRVDERGTDYVLPFEDARDDVIARVRMEKRQNVQGTLVAELKTKYNVVYVTDLGTLKPEDLFRLASEASNPREKIRYYEQFLQDYPDNERAYEAKFMIGFTYAEDLRNHAEAKKVFTEFLEEYPGSDLGDDARWMLENMDSGEHPEFESEAS
jgi:peptidyl-prolyl cis-trans isomerase C